MFRLLAGVQFVNVDQDQGRLPALLMELGAGQLSADRLTGAIVVEQLAALDRHCLLPMAAWLVDRGLLVEPLATFALAESARTRRPTAAWLAAEEAVLRALAASGLRFLVLKGAALARTLYPRVAARDRVDTDLLVRRSDWTAIAAILDRLGYRRDIGSLGAVALEEETWTLPLAGGGSHTVDLHHGLLSHPALRDVLGFDEMLAVARPLPGLPEGVRGPAPVHALLHAALHYYGHHGGQFRPLLWVLDIALLWQALSDHERTEAVSLATARGVAAILGQTLGVADRLFAAGVSPATFAALDTAGRSEWRAVLVEDRSGLPALLFALRAESGWQARLGYVRQVFFPPAEYMRWKYPDDPAPLWWLYVRRAVTGAWRQIHKGFSR